MTTLNVQFSDSTKTVIAAYFGCAQDATAYPNQGSVSASDERWKTFYDAQPAISQSNLPSPGA